MSKLVRDKIPMLCNQEGNAKYAFHIASENEYSLALRAKLQEEVNEFLASGSPEELVDIATVVNALLDLQGVDEITFGKMYFAKIEAKGNFKNRVIMSIK